MTEADILTEAVRRIREQFRPIRILLFGSRARGDAPEDSDFDLLVIVRDTVDTYRTCGQMHLALRDLPASFDVIVQRESEWSHASHDRASAQFAIGLEARAVDGLA